MYLRRYNSDHMMVQSLSVAYTTNELLPAFRTNTWFMVPDITFLKYMLSPFFLCSFGNVIVWEAKTTLIILFWQFFCNNESLFRFCTHDITVTTGCSFCHCWKKILIYLGYLPDFDRRCSGSKILFFVSFIKSVLKVEQRKQWSNTKLSKEVAVTVTLANHEMMSEHADPKVSL